MRQVHELNGNGCDRKVGENVGWVDWHDGLPDNTCAECDGGVRSDDTERDGGAPDNNTERDGCVCDDNIECDGGVSLDNIKRDGGKKCQEREWELCRMP